LASISELLNGMKEKTLALALVALLVDHPMSTMDVKARVIRLHAALLAEKIQPENRDWSLNQISRIVGDLMFILKKE